MRRVMALTFVLAVAALGAVFLNGRTEPVSHKGSPAFQALLTEAIARLEGVTERATVVTVGMAHAGDRPPVDTMYGTPTCDRDDTNCWDLTYDPTSPTCCASDLTCDASVTCARFYTCDSQYTCHGEETCDGTWTCWFSGCDVTGMTYDGSVTCDFAGKSCVEYTYQGNFTCDGTATCHQTCRGWPECGMETVYGQITCDRGDPDCWSLTLQGQVTCDAGAVTCDATNTCSRFYTCDSQYTCHGESTCNGTWTCWYSRCEAPDMTYDGSETCQSGDRDCIEYTYQGNFTCDGSPTCHETCSGWPGCAGPSGTDRTTWGKIKQQFHE